MKMKTPDEVVQVLGVSAVLFNRVKDSALSPSQLALREAEFLAKLSHKNVLKLEGFAEDASKNVVWLIFPWEANGTLKDFVASCEWEIPERLSLVRSVSFPYASRQPSEICNSDLRSCQWSGVPPQQKPPNMSWRPESIKF
mgnify:CR=1 FL=1